MTIDFEPYIKAYDETGDTESLASQLDDLIKLESKRRAGLVRVFRLWGVLIFILCFIGVGILFGLITPSTRYVTKTSFRPVQTVIRVNPTPTPKPPKRNVTLPLQNDFHGVSLLNQQVIRILDHGTDADHLARAAVLAGDAAKTANELQQYDTSMQTLTSANQEYTFTTDQLAHQVQDATNYVAQNGELSSQITGGIAGAEDALILATRSDQ